jgi:hypothetical protein
VFPTQFSECEAKLAVNVLLFLKFTHSKLCNACNTTNTWLEAMLKGLAAELLELLRR